MALFTTSLMVKGIGMSQAERLAFRILSFRLTLQWQCLTLPLHPHLAKIMSGSFSILAN